MNADDDVIVAMARGAVLIRGIPSKPGVGTLQLKCCNLPMRLGGWPTDEAARMLVGVDWSWQVAILTSGLERDRLVEWTEWVRARKPIAKHPRSIATVTQGWTDGTERTLRELGIL